MSAVILAVIVVMWAVVLVPMWLRRHENATENRSVDRFSSAMRVLSRRQPQTADRRYIVMPRREAEPTVHVSGALGSRRPRSSRPVPSAPPQPRTRPSMAQRRRRTLLALAGIVVLTFVLAAAGVVGWLVQGLFDVLLVAFVAHLRTQAKRTTVVRAPRRVAADPALQASPAAPAAAAPVSRRSAGRAPAAPSYAVSSSAAAVDEVAEEPASAEASGGAWEPVPVPPPTYTMKPRAPRHWTFAPPAEAQPVADGPVEGPVEPVTREAAELDEILEHRWAVND